MAIDLTTKFAPYTDEQFSTESRKSLLTNQDFDWSGARTVKIYKISTAKMNDYDRDGATLVDGKWSRYGDVESLNATTEMFMLSKDRSFTFPIDKLDADETQMQLSAASALARQTREVVIPEVDKYVYSVMTANAGTVADRATLAGWNVLDAIVKGNAVLDNAEVPETNRVIVVSPTTYYMLKACPDIFIDCDIALDMRLKGVVAMIDGCTVIKVPASRLPEDFGFMIAHPSATVAPVKLEDYTVHNNPPGINGDLVEGRIVYDAFVLDNKKMGIYYQPVTAGTTETA